VGARRAARNLLRESSSASRRFPQGARRPRGAAKRIGELGHVPIGPRAGSDRRFLKSESARYKPSSSAARHPNRSELHASHLFAPERRSRLAAAMATEQLDVLVVAG